MVDVWLNDANNDHWSVTFSEDENPDCSAFETGNAGGPPNTDFNGRPQTVSLTYDAPDDGGSAWPKYGEWA